MHSLRQTSAFARRHLLPINDSAHFPRQKCPHPAEVLAPSAEVLLGSSQDLFLQYFFQFNLGLDLLDLNKDFLYYSTSPPQQKFENLVSFCLLPRQFCSSFSNHNLRLPASSHLGIAAPGFLLSFVEVEHDEIDGESTGPMVCQT